MSKSCKTCIHKEVCAIREAFLFKHYYLPGAFHEAEEAKQKLDIGVNCNHHYEVGTPEG